ncbi:MULTISPECIES: MarR family winged helix-turn-helix transcriptional regulator [Thermomonosporaceae]|uniref:MarR family winged helix-turn-helix transcriptional regulator n=1 Tax=Thermomonosporaceae TaxID=2012 RepID=UPI00255AA71A|nr:MULTISPECIES: MarR family transcriptional regulator [Thermomonosporaceae]MDL4770834.1 MarR family transcriptional regulator [Actinomadura xylanilytica]
MDQSPEIDELELAAGLGRVVSLMRSLALPRDRSMTAVSTLATLERFGPRRVTELAVFEGVTQPAMTQLVSRLEREGLAERGPLPADGRAVVVRVTTAGRAELAGRRAAQARDLAALLAGLPAGDREAIAAALPALNRLTGLTHGPGARPPADPPTSRSDG